MKQYICGKNSVIDAINNNVDISVIYTTTPLELNNAKIEQKIVTKEFLNKLVEVNHQGIVAELKEYNYYDINTLLKEKPSKVLVLDHIQDPHNLGAILRTSNAFGIKFIILPKDRAVAVNATVLKVASGGQVGLKLIKVNSLFEAVKKLKNSGYWIYSSAISSKSKDVNTIKEYNEPTCLILGNESTGVSKTLLNISDEEIFIPMKGTVQSLNVSVAAGILMSKL